MRDGVVFWFAVGSIGLMSTWACGSSDGGGARNAAGSTSGGSSAGGMAAGGASGSTSGGTTSGGSTSGGSGGGVAACNPTAGPMKGDGTALVIDDIDDTDTTFMTAGVGSGSWDFSKDSSTGTLTPNGTAELAPVEGGQSGTALHVQGTGLTGWGASLAAFLNGPTSSFDASEYGGVAFYIKGTTSVQEGENKLMVQARMPDVLPGPGSCCSDTVMGSECYSGHRAVISVTSDWQEVKLPWSSFVGPTWGLGATTPFDPNRVRDINFSFNNDAMAMGDGATFDVWIDGLRFMAADEMGTGGTGGTGGTSGAGGMGGANEGGAGGA